MDLETLKQRNEANRQKMATRLAELSLSAEERTAILESRMVELAQVRNETLAKMRLLRGVFDGDTSTSQTINLGRIEGQMLYADITYGMRWINFYSTNGSQSSGDDLKLGSTVIADTYSIDSTPFELEFIDGQASWSHREDGHPTLEARRALLDHAEARVTDGCQTADMLIEAVSDPALNPALATKWAELYQQA